MDNKEVKRVKVGVHDAYMQTIHSLNRLHHFNVRVGKRTLTPAGVAEREKLEYNVARSLTEAAKFSLAESERIIDANLGTSS